MMPPSIGYQRALDILEGRYGNTLEIVQKWTKNITERANIKGPADIRDFPDDLQCCEDMLENMGHLQDLEHVHYMKIGRN